MININLTGVISNYVDGYSLISPYQQDVIFTSGDDGYVNVAVVDSSKNAVDLSDSTLYYSVSSATTGDLLFSSQPITIVGDENNTARFLITSDNTTNSTLSYRSDCVLIDAAGNTSHIIPRSFFTLVPSVYSAA